MYKLESPLEDGDTKNWIKELEISFDNLKNFESNKNNAVLEIYFDFIKKSYQKIDKIREALVRLSKKESL